MKKGIPIKNRFEIYIGLDINSVFRCFDKADIIDKNDMGNEYVWLKCWIYPYDQRILCEICFKNDLIWEIVLYPFINNITGIESWDDVSEKQMSREKELCNQWLAEHKDPFHDKAEVFEDRRNLSAGILIR